MLPEAWNARFSHASLEAPLPAGGGLGCEAGDARVRVGGEDFIPAVQLFEQRSERSKQRWEVYEALRGIECAEFFYACGEQAACADEVAVAQMMKGDGDLDDPLQKLFALARALHPQFFEHLVAIKELLLIEKIDALVQKQGLMRC